MSISSRIVFFLLILLLFLISGPQTLCAAEPVQRSGFTYYFENQLRLSEADSTLRATRTRLRTLLRNDLDFSADVFFVESEATFDSLVGGVFPEWGAAAAIPIWNRIVIKSPDVFQLNRPLSELLSHEYTHLALAHRTGLGSPPRWFDEGLAMMTSMEWSWSNSLTMNLAALTGDMVSLREIDRVNRFGAAKARVAYSQSYLSVQFMFNEYGVEAVNIFLDNIAQGQSIDRALIASTGSDYTDFEREIDVYLRGRFNLVGLLADTMYLWLVLAVILIVGFILSMKRRKNYYRKWKEEEKLASTDFDYGDPDNPEQIDDDEPWRE
ncbi:MAG: hypothetical protein J7J98_04575 [candidate division Zixibacteria bacterium]|nr:hypothetical protein [candidate division Zixibacteria bacterium]